MSDASSADGEPAAERGARQSLFEPYWDEEAVQAGLRSGHLVRGVLRASGNRLSIAHVRPDGAAQKGLPDLLLKGKKARNRAVHGDIVAVAPLDDVEEEEEGQEEDDAGQDFPAAPVQSESSDSDEEVVLNKGVVKNDDEQAGKGGDDGQAAQPRPKIPQWIQGHSDRPTKAKIVAILEPKGSGRVIICTLHPNDRNRTSTDDGIVKGDDTLLKAKPTDRRMPWILIQINDVTRKVLGIPEEKLDKYKLWPVQMLMWKESSSLPLGRLKGECVGQAGDLVAEEKHALIEHELIEHDLEFEDKQLDEVDDLVRLAKSTFDEEVTRRTDLRSKRIFTIDPATAKDLDDAIHVDRLPGDEQVEIGVHIADVAHFLKLGSITDTEAQRRTTSVYLINRVMPMLPHGLCNFLCSLNPDEPKLSFSAFFRLDLATGELCKDPAPWFRKTAMRSCCRLNYDEVQEVLDGKAIDEPPVYGGYMWEQIKDDIFLLYDVCGKVRRGRLDGGALSISKQKMIFHTRESEDGVPKGYHLESHSASHWIIEELMLLANRCVAEHIANSKLSEVAVLRNHKRPDEKKAEALSKMLTGNLGLQWDASHAGALYRSCQAIYRKYGETLGLCVEMMVMRSGMYQAEYFVCNEETDPHHFALNFDYYTHFTSPIRRYPDVMVHRVLEALLLNKEGGGLHFHAKEQAEKLVTVCNEKKQATRKCSEQLDRAVFCIFLRSRKEWFYTIGTVLGFQRDTNTSGGNNNSVTVYCAQLGRESKAMLCDMEGPNATPLIQSEVEDELLLPQSWRFTSRGSLELQWLPKSGDRSMLRCQRLQTLSCVPIVIIPTDTVPINYAVFFVSPFHRKSAEVLKNVPEDAARGFVWKEVEEDGVQVVHDALAHAVAAASDDEGVQLTYNAMAESEIL